MPRPSVSKSVTPKGHPTSANNGPTGPTNAHDIKRGRPRKFETVSWFGMKLTPEDRDKIRNLAKLEGKTSSRLILDLVDAHFRKVGGSKTSRELMRLSPRERERILEAEAKNAIEFYQLKKNGS